MRVTIADDRRLPCRDSRTMTIKNRHTVVARWKWSRKQTKVRNAIATLPYKVCATVGQIAGFFLSGMRLSSAARGDEILAAFAATWWR